MRLNHQRDRLIQCTAEACHAVTHMRSAIIAKMNSPYGDGSKSNMVNAETDVLPRLNEILTTLVECLEEVGFDQNGYPVPPPKAVRIW